MKYKTRFTFPLLVIGTLSAAVYGQSPIPTYQQIAKIAIPGGLGSFDIAWVDPGSQRFYLADRSATAGTGRIDVIDTQKNTFLYSIGGFVGVVPGAGKSGPNGVVAIPQLNQLYVGDGDSTVKVVDLTAQKVIATISTGGTARADELAYDPLDHIVMIGNPNDNPPFLTFISADTQKVLGRYTYSSGQSVANGGGLEQPVWNPLTKRFALSVPASNSSIGEIDIINPITMLVEQSFPTAACSPTGLAITPNQRLITACGMILDARNGTIYATITGASSDEIWYNPGDDRVYFGSNGAVVDVESRQLVAYFAGAAGHTIAVDPNNNHIFAPVTGAGVLVYAAQ